MKKILVLTVRFVTTLNKPANIFLLLSISGIFFFGQNLHIGIPLLARKTPSSPNMK